MNKFLAALVFFLLSNCSLDTKSGIWTQEKIEELKKDKVKIIFKDQKILNKEFNPELSIKIDTSNSLVKNFNNNSNNLGLSLFDENIKRSSKFKFKRIDDFNYFEPDLVSDGNSFVFFDDKSNLFKFDKNFNLIWKKNIYSKKEIKNKPFLSLVLHDNSLVVTDSLGSIFRLDYNSGEIIWKNKSQNPFNSQTKIYDNKVYAIDLNNIIRCYSLDDGNELWKLNSDNTFLKSDKRNSIAIKNGIIYFNNSIGDISAVVANNGSLLWQIPTQNSQIYESAFSLKISDLVISDNNLFFSNNRNEIYSINLTNGILNWKQSVNSSTRPIIINNFIFSVSDEGYLFILDKDSGNILKITDLFDVFKSKKKLNLSPVGFIVGKNNIILTTNKGKLLIVDLNTGKTKSILKIDNQIISRPFVFDRKILIVKDNAIVRLN